MPFIKAPIFLDFNNLPSRQLSFSVDVMSALLCSKSITTRKWSCLDQPGENNKSQIVGFTQKQSATFAVLQLDRLVSFIHWRSKLKQELNAFAKPKSSWIWNVCHIFVNFAHFVGMWWFGCFPYFLNICLKIHQFDINKSQQVELLLFTGSTSPVAWQLQTLVTPHWHPLLWCLPDGATTRRSQKRFRGVRWGTRVCVDGYSAVPGCSSSVSTS